jgi:diguanylate cyclase (GGDEF)-like protein
MPLQLKSRVEPIEESAAAAQLRRGFRALRFEQRLESDYQNAHLLANRRQIRRNLVLAVGLVAAFSAMDRMLLHGASQVVPDILRFIVIAPLICVLIAVCLVGSFTRWYPLLVQVIAPVAGVCVVVIQMRAARAGVQLVFATVLIAVIYVSFLIGMQFYAALRSNLLILAGYVATALNSGLSSAEVSYSILVLILMNTVCGVVAYSLEMANRMSYLEAKVLEETAMRDGLTGIHNRRAFDDRVVELWNQAIREQVPLAMLLVDIDFFKPFNDRYGHQAGDETLKTVAATLSHFARRPLDFTARYGGEEFAVVLFGVDRVFVTELARRMRAEVEALGIAHDRSTASSSLTVSIGAACVRPVAARSHGGMIQLADEALYAAKNQGRNRVVVMEQEYADLKTGAFRGPKRAS